MTEREIALEGQLVASQITVGRLMLSIRLIERIAEGASTKTAAQRLGAIRGLCRAALAHKAITNGSETNGNATRLPPV